MSDGEEESQDLRPIELETHRRTPPPLDDKDIAEMSQISADIDDAEKFELTFEVVDTSSMDEDAAVDSAPDEEISKILTPPSADKKKKKTGHVDGNLDDEPEDFEKEEGWNENKEDGSAEFRMPTKLLKSMANELLDDFHSPLPVRSTSSSASRKRSSNEALETPKSGKKHHSSASELLDEFRSPLATSSSHNTSSSPSVLKRSAKMEVPPAIETPKRGAMTK